MSDEAYQEDLAFIKSLLDWAEQYVEFNRDNPAVSIAGMPVTDGTTYRIQCAKRSFEKLTTLE